jgi:hypothetical protein
MKSKTKIGAAVLIVILVLIQFFRPARNLSGNNQNAIGNKYPIPDSVALILKTACYDCHSNYTVCPWYFNVQPVGWWLTHHVNEGKQHLNFSEFLSYPVGRQYHKIQEVKKELQKNAMPLNSYKWIHTDARLSPEQKEILIKWSEGIAAIIKSTTPADSLLDKGHERHD